MERTHGASSYQQMFPPFVEGSFAVSAKRCHFSRDQDNFADASVHGEPKRSKLLALGQLRSSICTESKRLPRLPGYFAPTLRAFFDGGVTEDSSRRRDG